MNDNLISEIAGALAEPNVELVSQIITVIGEERAREFLRQALEVEAGGGLVTKAGGRRRTPGGVFFYLVRGSLRSKERRQLWPQDYQKKKPAAAGPEPLTWEEALALIAQVIKETGEAKTVKVTLVGRPLKVISQKDCVVASLKAGKTPDLPKGLPAVPEGSAITWAVFIANKQWNRVKESIERNANDQLVIEGYPIVGKNGVAVVMATNCKSVLMERAQRAQSRDTGQ